MYFWCVGMSDWLLYCIGYGMDVIGCEVLFFVDGYECIIELGMCLIIEFGIYVEGIGGFCYFDIVLIGDDGFVMLIGGLVSIGVLMFLMYFWRMFGGCCWVGVDELYLVGGEIFC